MKQALKNILQSSMKNRKLLQLLVIIALIISSAKVDLFAQSSNPQPKMRLCKSDEVSKCFNYDIFNKSNPRFVYMLNKETKDSLFYVQFDVTTGEIINRKTIPNPLNEKYNNYIPQPYSPDMKWFMFRDISDQNGCTMQNMINYADKNHFALKKIYYEYDFDTLNKNLFLSIPTPDSRQLAGAIYKSNYETNDTGKIIIKNVTGKKFTYDSKRNHIITVDFEEIIGIGFRTLIQFFDANTGELVKQLTPYDGMSYPPDGEKFKQFVRLKMLIGNNKLLLLSGNNEQFILDLETYELKLINKYKNEAKNSFAYNQNIFYKSDSIMICNEYTSTKKDSLRIFLVNINTDKIILDKIIVGEEKMDDNFLSAYMLENFGLFITFDPEALGCIKVYDINDLDDNLSEVPTNSVNEMENIFPNPTNGIVQINLTEINTPLNITISNLNGEIVKNITNVAIINNQVNLNIQDLSSGNYFVRLQSATYLKTLKIIKGA